ncbi:bifunctional protein-disulfide isomerase/oxidoreductase DsbC [Catenovulum maritimum]|uniref:Thiol:disulfide interchange protein n=1 Tax=Catenovulum maritimum TaxID=1513271 RepID=A0A0J8JIF7_9ALTE|nr:bifunctional protein-disulfide isomerase/oxidoreductase DsbC [Catenovulum maritimum]KMT64241.1 thiol:disulfide interchange protein [Catenovulum maritimum]
MLNKLKLFILCSSVLSLNLFAADKNHTAIKAQLDMMGLSVKSIEASPINNMLQVMTSKGLFYVSEDGEYLFHGSLFNLKKGLVNESELVLAKHRKEDLDKFSGSTIEYKAKNEKYVINVFTDITCGYCRKLHNEMQGYNDLGITVRYLAFPRGGIASQSYNDMVSIWCADSPKKAMDTGKAGGRLTAKTCANDIKEQYEFGAQSGVTGTPAIMLENGVLIPGYRPPADMLSALQGV